MPEYEDGKWLTDFAFLMDLAACLNELNMSSRGKSTYLCYLSNHYSV